MKEKCLITSIISLFLCMQNTFLLSLLPFLHYLIIFLPYGTRARPYGLFPLCTCSGTKVRTTDRRVKKKETQNSPRARAFFFLEPFDVCTCVCIVQLVIPFLLLLVLLSHNSCALSSFFLRVYNLFDRREREKKKRKKKREKHRKKTREERDENAVEQCSLDQ